MARRVSLQPDGKKEEQAALDGRSSPKLRGRRAGDISPEQIETFLSTLSETCNVVRSAKAAGFSANWAYRKRRSDAAFRNGWAAAVREGYAKLELILLERAIKGTPKLVRTAAGGDRVMRDYSPALAIALLRRHAETADSAGAEEDEEQLSELREKILDKLQRVHERELAAGGGSDGGTIETKAAVRRSRGQALALIRRGMGAGRG